MIPKFRAWHKTEKKMLVDALHGITFGDSVSAWEVMKDGGSYIVDYELDDVDLMQSTGLKDKNGVEIFEGDIVDYGDGSKAQIVWDNEEAGFRKEWNDGTLGLKLSKVDLELFEIIGNIHENPDLLEGK